MADGAVETVGARLVLYRGSFFTNATEATAAMDKLAASLERVKAAGADGIITAPVLASAKAGTAAAEDAATATAGETDAVLAASVAYKAKKKAMDDAAVSLKKVTASSSVGSQLSNLAGGRLVTSIAKYGSIAIAGTLYEGIKGWNVASKAFLQSVTQAQLPMNRLPALMAYATKISNKYGDSLADVAGQMFHIISAKGGVKESNQQIEKLMLSTAQLTAVGNVPKGSEAVNVGRIIPGVSNANLAGIGRSGTKIAAAISAMVGTGDITMDQAIQMLGRGPLISGMVTRMKGADLFGWMDVMTKLAGSTSSAATTVAHSAQLIFNPSEQATKAEGMLGIQFGQLRKEATGKGGMPAVLKTLYSAMTSKTLAQIENDPRLANFTYNNLRGGAAAVAQLNAWDPSPQFMKDLATPVAQRTAAQKTDLETFWISKMYGGARFAQPIEAILGDQKQYAGTIAQINKATNPAAFDKVLKAWLANPANQIGIAENQLHNFSIAIGHIAQPVMLKGLNVLKDIFGWLSEHTGILQALMGFAASVVGLAIAAKAIKGIIGLAKDISAFKTGIGNLLSHVPGLSGLATPTAGFTEATTTFELSVQEFREAVMQLTAAQTGLIAKEDLPVLAGGTATRDAEKAGVFGANASGLFGIGLGTTAALGLTAIATYTAVGKGIQGLVKNSDQNIKNPYQQAARLYLDSLPSYGRGSPQTIQALGYLTKSIHTKAQMNALLRKYGYSTAEVDTTIGRERKNDPKYAAALNLKAHDELNTAMADAADKHRKAAEEQVKAANQNIRAAQLFEEFATKLQSQGVTAVVSGTQALQGLSQTVANKAARS